MPKLRVLSGKELCKSLIKEGFTIIRQKGSHVRLVHQSPIVSYHVTVPIHGQIDRGTLSGIMRSVGRCLSQDKIKEIFYA